ncbi:MAG: preprotein translocase subunit SecE [Longimicrobiales bacterium]
MLQKITDTRVFLEESWAELQRVTWPDYQQLKNATWVIIAFSVVVALVIWLMDKFSGALINLILRVFGA